MSDRRSNQPRRNIAPRRHPRERRRHAKDRYAVIEIAGAELRAVMLVRKPDGAPDQVKSAIMQWRKEALSLNSEAGCAELAEALKEISEQHDLQGAQIQFVLGGEFCVTKAVLGSTEEVRNELQQLEQRSRLYLMLGPGEKVTVSNSRPIDARHQYAVAAVCNQKTLDTIHRAATQAGMQIESIEPALVATSRAIGRLVDAPKEPCLLIHIDQKTVELGVCHDGRLLLDYRPGGRTDPTELVEVVRTHLGRLQRHVGRQLHQPPPKLRRVYLCGEENAVERAFPVFSACEQFEVERIAPSKIQATWEFEKGTQVSATAPALGALLSTYVPSSERDAPNFMTHILASTRTPLQPILIRSAMPLVAVILIAFSVLFANFRQQSSINALQEQVDSLASMQAQARELRLKITSAEAKLVQIRALAESMQAVPAGNIVARIGHCMPSDVWLNKLVVENMRSIQIIGTSYLEAGVFDFVRWLEHSPGFEDVALRGTQPGRAPSGPAINFEVELNLADFNGPVEEVARNE